MDVERKEQEPVKHTKSSGSESTDSIKIDTANNSSTNMNNDQYVDPKENDVLELDCKGLTQREIAHKLGISQPSVCRYLKKAHESLMESRIDYVQEALRDHHRAKLGQDRALQGLWSIAEDPTTPSADRLRAYSLIIQCNTRKSQATTTARNLSQWKVLEEKAEVDKEWAELSDEEKIRRSFERHHHSNKS